MRSEKKENWIRRIIEFFIYYIFSIFGIENLKGFGN